MFEGVSRVSEVLYTFGLAELGESEEKARQRKGDGGGGGGK